MKKLLSNINSILALSFSLAKVNFKLRNEGSYLGFLWYLLNPLALFFVILFVRNHAFANSFIPLFPAYLLVGLLMFNFFSQTVGASIGVIALNANLIKSIKIPQEAIVLSRVIQALLSHLFEIIILVVCIFYFSVNISAIFFYLLIFLLLTVFVAGLSFLFATIGAYVSDLSNVWVVFMQLVFFVTPIFHMPDSDSLLLQLNLFNPLYYFIKAAREMFIYGKSPSALLILGLFLISIVSLVLGLFVFQRQKSKFAEIV
jgi:ABC-type polysaccharide/polyol phosphate export permease